MSQILIATRGGAVERDGLQSRRLHVGDKPVPIERCPDRIARPSVSESEVEQLAGRHAFPPRDRARFEPPSAPNSLATDRTVCLWVLSVPSNLIRNIHAADIHRHDINRNRGLKPAIMGPL